MDWNRTKQSFIYKTTIFFFSISICIFSLYALFNTLSNTKTISLGIRNQSTGGRKSGDCYFQVSDKAREGEIKKENEISTSSLIRRSLFFSPKIVSSSGSSSKRRILNIPGSFPPRCISKCGRCSPCKPVRVLVPPGTPVLSEYYPEAWRCKCGNKTYMP